MTKKKIALLLSIMFVAVIIIGFFQFYLKPYQFNIDNASIQAEITNWRNRGELNSEKVTVIQTVRLDDSNTYISLFQLDNNNIGYARVIQGLNGKGKIEGIGSGTNTISYKQIRTNKGSFGIIYGYNENFNIDHIQIKTRDNRVNYIEQIAEDETFISYYEIPKKGDSNRYLEFTLYDKDNNELAVYKNPD